MLVIEDAVRVVLNARYVGTRLWQTRPIPAVSPPRVSPCLGLFPRD